MWNEFNWGTGYWGYGVQGTIWELEKAQAETITTTDDYSLSFDKLLENSAASTFEMTDEFLQESAGYYYVEPSNVIDLDDRSAAAYTEATAASTTWVEQTTAAGTWSEI